MAITQGDGGSLRRAKETERQPVHKTEEFRERIRRIKEREAQQPAAPQAAAPVQPAPPPKTETPQFIPLPRGRGGIPAEFYRQKQEEKKETIRTQVKQELYSFLSSNPGVQVDTNIKDYIEYETELRYTQEKTKVDQGASHTQRHANRVESLQDKKLLNEIRADVIKSVPSHMVADREKIKKFVEERTQEIYQQHKQPRYIFLADGRPFYFDNNNERADLEMALLGESPIRKKWTMAKYDIANGIMNTLEWVSNPSIRLEEVATDKENKSVLGAMMQLGLNGVMLGVEYAVGGVSQLFESAQEQKHAQLLREAEAVKYTDPERAAAIMHQADRIKTQLDFAKTTDDRIQIAKEAAKSAWENLVESRQESMEGATPGARVQGPEYFDKKIQEQEAARQEAVTLRESATNAYRTGDYTTAIEMVKQAQQKDRESRVGDPYGAYTWIRQPESEAKFLEDAALLELQKGEPLSDSEIRRLKEYHTNGWTEITGQGIFDPVNLIPAAILEDILKVGGKAVKVTVNAVGEVPGIKQLAAPVRWLKRQTVVSSANKIAARTTNVIQEINNAYLTNEDSIKALTEINKTIKRAKSVATEAEARAIFDAARPQIAGLQNISFSQFKGLMDAADHLPSGDWAKIYQDALMKAEDDIIARATANGIDPKEVLSEVSKSRQAMQMVAADIHSAVVDPHRIYKGSRFTDDTIGGWIVKVARELSGEKINETLVTNGFDEFVTNIGKTTTEDKKAFIKFMGRGMESFVGASAIIKDWWTAMVLTTPRYFLGNFFDTAFRSVVYGGNLWDDLTTLFTSTQRTLVDELGILPQELTQSLARSDLDFAENVTNRLLHEGWKPGAGIFSYYKYEYDRLMAAGEQQAKRALMEKALSRITGNGKLTNAMVHLGDGLAIRTSMGIKAWQGAIADFNTAVEFTYRLRMFHKEYFKAMELLEPKFLEKGLEGLSPTSRVIAKQIWKSAEGNPRRIAAYAEALVGNKPIKGTPAEWAFVVPPEIENITKGMDATDRQLFVASVRTSLDDFIQTSAKAGKELKGKDFEKFFDEYVDGFRNELQARMSQSHDFKDIDTTIRKDGKMAEEPHPNDLRGSAPVPKADARQEAIRKATENLRRNKRARTEDVVKDFETAVSSYASVERVPGNDIVREMVNGKPVIRIGEQVLKSKPNALYDELHEAMIQVFRNQDSDMILRGGFKNLDEYETTFRSFMDDPTSLMNADERKFLTIVNQLEYNPQLRDLLERTRRTADGQINRIKYDSALDTYRDLGVYSDSYGFDRPPEEIFEFEAQTIREQPGFHMSAVNENVLATRNLARTASEIGPEVNAKVSEFLARWNVYREELKQVFAFTYPGPLMKSIKGGDRHKGWELFYKMSATEFMNEARIKDDLVKLFASDPAQAEKMIDDAMEDFGEYFLNQNGIKIEWDANNEKIMRAEMIADGRKRSIVEDRDLAMIQRRLFTKDITKKINANPIIQINKNSKTKLRNQLRNALRNTFDLPTNRAEAWAKVMEKHAEVWTKTTGRPIEEYYARLGFQKLEDTRGLGTAAEFRMTKRGAVRRQDGNFIFYGLGQSNFESVVRESAELFWDDLYMMAEHSDQASRDFAALKKFIEKKAPGKPIRGNRLNKEQSDILTSLFTGYMHSGDGPDISIKGGVEQFKKWLLATFDAAQETPLMGDMTDEVYSVFNRMFVEEKINDVPKVTPRKIKAMAKEAGVKFADEDELLRIINESVSPGSTAPDAARLSPELQEEYDSLRLDWEGADEEYRALIEENADLAGDNVMANATIGNNPKVAAAEEKLSAAQAALRDFEARIAGEQQATAVPIEGAAAMPTQPFKSLDEVPTDVAAQAIGAVRENKVLKELNEGWEVWRTNRSLVGFPDSALVDPDTFKAYLRQRMTEEWSEASNYYTRLLWEVEQWENAMLNYHTGDDFAEAFFPRVPEAQISDGMRTFIRNQEKMMSNYEIALRALDDWKKYLADMADNGHPAFVMPQDMKGEILNWSRKASEDKATLQDLIINGGKHEGREYSGAIDKVNKVMIDYQYSNNFDNIMRNFFPFWKFPSRSFPFWMETMATHPHLIANYEKIQRLSRSQRYQAGAMTSSGKPLPSLDGYIKIPGTDTWFNPLAPFSFRYVLDIAKSKDDVMYAANTAEEQMEPKAFLVKELMSTGQVYGFSLSPWMAWLMKDAAGIPDEVLPRYPFSPLMPLIPRWAIRDLISKADRYNLPFGLNAGDLVEGAADRLYPEVPWHDYLVERQILEQTLAKIQGANLTDAQKMKLVNEAKEAIKLKGDNAIWQAAYEEITTDASKRSLVSLFTGFHPKEFSDAQALLLQLRNERNQLKSSLNNEFQATLFDIPINADAAWKRYMDAIDSPEGWVYRLYTDVGWVRDDHGELVRDPKERAHYLAQKIEQDEDLQIYYDKMADLQNWYNETLRALPVGAEWEQVKGVYEKYAEKRADLDYLRSYEKHYGTNKPRELIERDIMDDWFRAVNTTRPRWDVEKGETYDQYLARVEEWQTNLPNMAPILLRSFTRMADLNKTLDALHDDQKLSPDFFSQLVSMTTQDGLEEWEKAHDDIFDALNKAWGDTYWKGYWNRVIGKSGYEVDLAERDFFQHHQNPPDAAGLYAWIQGYYGPDRFSLDDVKKWVEETDVMSIDERRMAGQEDPDDFKKRQEIWDMLSLLGPGGRNRKVFDTAFLNAGGDPDALTAWYEENGRAYATRPEKLEALHAALQGTINDLELKQPHRAELVQWIQAQDENEVFQKVISDELGERFFDWTDKNGIPQMGLLGYYGNLSYDMKQELRRYNPEMYDAVQSYYDMKDTFAEQHPTWAMYYGFDAEPTVALKEQPTTSSFLTPPNPQAPIIPDNVRATVKRETDDDEGGGTPLPPPPPPLVSGSTSTTAPTKPDYVPMFKIDSRVSADVSQGLLNLVGEKMAWEISGVQSGRKISSAGISFLKSLASRYPQYSAEINQILAKGT